MSRKITAEELRAIAEGRLMLNVRNGVTVSRSMLAKVADEMDALSTATPAEEDEHEVMHVYEGDGGVIIRENGNVSTFGVQSPEAMAAFHAATTLPAGEVGELAAFAAENERLRKAVQRQVDNIDRWMETGIPANAEESQSIYEQMKYALEKGTAE